MEITLMIAMILVAYYVGRITAKGGGSHEHEHIWKITSAKAFLEHGSGGDLGRRKTRILKNCFCEKYDVEIIDGHWEIEELRAGGI